DLVPLDKDAGYLGGRTFAHNSGEPVEARTLLKVAALSLGNSARYWISGQAEGRDKLTNDVFDGRISQEEFDQRAHGAQVLYFDTIGASSASTLSLKLDSEYITSSVRL